ncbi:hypothetical protein GCM10017786_43870 [Amycolatopsis deserti]|uniref:Uncharacterized protein n=1 Tax=Amycolatopsis deserti TaxID=185696 RepID=A0ABQ3J7C4_9PSEU|nr:hypothetical protein GCM10017786_43870 [Amycolatopsis deserti]
MTPLEFPATAARGAVRPEAGAIRATAGSGRRWWCGGGVVRAHGTPRLGSAATAARDGRARGAVRLAAWAVGATADRGYHRRWRASGCHREVTP